MKVLVTGKNLDIGVALRGHIEAKVDALANRYFDGAVRAQVLVEKLRGKFLSDCTLNLTTGLKLQAHGEAVEAMASFEAAAGHLERQLRRYKQRLKDHQRSRQSPVVSADAALWRIPASAEDEAAEEPGLNPAVVAESPQSVPELSVGEAVMQLDISTMPFVLFRNGRDGALNVVYRRPDGHIGWVDPGVQPKT